MRFGLVKPDSNLLFWTIGCQFTATPLKPKPPVKVLHQVGINLMGHTLTMTGVAVYSKLYRSVSIVYFILILEGILNFSHLHSNDLGSCVSFKLSLQNLPKYHKVLCVFIDNLNRTAGYCVYCDL